MRTLNLNVGIFDSGLGGLSLLRELQKLNFSPSKSQSISQEIFSINYYYISDLKFSPYGNKTTEQIQNRSLELTENLLASTNGDIQLIVVACNTATTQAISTLRKEFPLPFVGIEPYLKYLIKHPKSQEDLNTLDMTNSSHQSDPLLLEKPFRPVLLLTKASSESPRFKSLLFELDTHEKISIFIPEGLATLIEEKIHLRNSSLFQKELEKILLPIIGLNYTHAILGCTHYPLVSREIEKILNLACISPEKFVAKRVMDLLESKINLTPYPYKENKKINFESIEPNFYFACTGQDSNFLEKWKAICGPS
jgi:glutamate racemase